MPPLTGFIVRRARSVAWPVPGIARRPASWLALIPVALLALGVAACGQDDPRGSASLPTRVVAEGSTTPVAASTAPQPTREAGALSLAGRSEDALSRAPFLSDRSVDASGLAAPPVDGPSVLAAAAAPRQEPSTAPTPAPLAVPVATVETPAPAGEAPPALNVRATGLFRGMNEARAAHGLGPFALAADLSLIAHRRSADMSAGGYFAHVSPTGESWLSLLAATGTRVLGGGENLARVSGDEANSVAIAIAHLMDSATHRANILNTHFDEVGVAAVTDADGVTVFTTIFATR